MGGEPRARLCHPVVADDVRYGESAVDSAGGFRVVALDRAFDPASEELAPLIVLHDRMTRATEVLPLA